MANIKSRSTKIEWTEKTWNPVTGCSKISAGCANCYAEKMSLRLQAMGQKKYENGFAVTLHPETLREPMTWRTSHTVFVCSMGDLFHDSVPFDFIDKVMAVIESTPMHTFQLLTKRAERMSEYFATRSIPKNAWVGVTVDVQNSKSRIEHLRNLDATVKFLSCEPLLEDLGALNLQGIDWVIVGGESGSNARPMKEEWVLSLQKQCEEQESAFFFKQWGTWGADGVKRSKKANGKELNGQIYQEMPNATSKSNHLNSRTLDNSNESINMYRGNYNNKKEIIMKENVNANEVINKNENGNVDVNSTEQRIDKMILTSGIKAEGNIENPIPEKEGFWIIPDKDGKCEWVLRAIKIGNVLFWVTTIIDPAEERGFAVRLAEWSTECLINQLKEIKKSYERKFSLKFRRQGCLEIIITGIADQIALRDVWDHIEGLAHLENSLRSLSKSQVAEIESATSLKKLSTLLVNHLKLSKESRGETSN